MRVSLEQGNKEGSKVPSEVAVRAVGEEGEVQGEETELKLQKLVQPHFLRSLCFSINGEPTGLLGRGTESTRMIQLVTGKTVTGG